MKKIFEYSNYRQFLKDYYNEKKKTTGYFTHRYFAQNACFSSPVFLKLVMDGKTNLSEKSINNLAGALDFDPTELAYFRNLVYFNQSKSFEKKKEYLETLRKLNKELCATVLDTDQYDFYEKWYTSALRELIVHAKKPQDYKKLGAMLIPPLKTRETKQALELLKKTNLLKQNSDGTFSQTSKLITTGSEVESLAVRGLHVQMGQLAVSAIEQVAKEDRDISGITMGISNNAFDIIKKELESFRSKIMAIVANDGDFERVYRLNLQLFPLSKKISEEDGEESKNGK
jgi:uncharacterized protein (TIGR02147 family)